MVGSGEEYTDGALQQRWIKKWLTVRFFGPSIFAMYLMEYIGMNARFEECPPSALSILGEYCLTHVIHPR